MFTFKIPFIISILQQCLFSLRGIKAFIKTFSQVFCRISSVDRDHRVNIEEKTRHTYMHNTHCENYQQHAEK